MTQVEWVWHQHMGYGHRTNQKSRRSADLEDGLRRELWMSTEYCTLYNY